ncbi:M56 family metallopeptidase [Pedobacter sp. KR3-3]|uniref:M56 family metallopeptidase n=1 Tax=Pedobacter albus TaxID=3113905 RepID=A0ABU7I2Q6_9SPHI|nr:M56 family metallopeptidase [Pedobacter sp. KR3-3]MEE1943669.1 M56 family metallopeptidase [Pedobacter sp. KR3-3]
MDWLYYLLEANLYLIIFYGFYRLLLQNQTFYNSNRYYLLASSFTAFALPILQIGYLRPSLPYEEVAIVQDVNLVALQPVAKLEPTFQLTDYFYIFYIGIAICFAFKLLLAILKILKLSINAKKHYNKSFTIVELKDEKEAFSFFNLLFIHPQMAEKQVVLKHELVHIKQKHTLDVLFFELLQIVCWFNPIIYFIKKDIKLLHEYIADELSTTNNQQKHDYVMFLIENSFGIVPQKLTNQIFNQSILKRRINMLNKKRTTSWARLKLLLALPLGGAMLCTSTMAFTKDYGYVDLFPEKNKAAQGQVVETVAVQEPAQSEGKTFYPRNEYSKSKGETAVIVDKRHIVINGKPVADVAKFHGVSQANSISYLNVANAVKKYGDKGKHGAVEITGTHLKYLELVPPPVRENPTVKEDQVRFPPPIVKPDDKFYTRYGIDKTTRKPVLREKRYILINGKAVEDLSTFYGVSNAESIKNLSREKAIAKYGDKGQNGAVEITGKNIQYFTKVTLPRPPAVQPPPAYAKNSVKFPPPVVKADQVTPPPPIEERPSKAKARKARPIKLKEGDVIKFPPPVIKEDKKGNNDEADLKAKVAALPSVSIASTDPDNAMKQLYIKSAKEKQIAAMGTEQAFQSTKPDSKVSYSITVKEPQERLKSALGKEVYQNLGSKVDQQTPRITVKPSVKETKKEAKQPITLELLPTKNQP